MLIVRWTYHGFVIYGLAVSEDLYAYMNIHGFGYVLLISIF